MRKIGMIGIISNPVRSKNSHNGGWTRVCVKALQYALESEISILTEKDDWNEYESLIINEGVNYKKGVYNFFGGVSMSTKEKLHKLMNYSGNLYCINEAVDYNHMCSKRKELSHIDFNFKKPSVIDLSKISDKLVLGDSHSISVYKDGYSISRNDGKTLHGFLKEGISSYIPKNINDLIFYAGNIDIRFHIKTNGGILAIDKILEELDHQLSYLKLDKISVCGLLPIEDESRKIPGTGKYNGKNFIGTFEERSEYVKYFNTCLKKICKVRGWNFLEWGFDYNEKLDFNHMEARQSVHLRPTSYMFNKNTNQLKLF